jgi:pimeloyl-ACP methyl ester carboxylesterase
MDIETLYQNKGGAMHQALATRYAGLAATSAGDPNDDRPPLLFLHGLSFDRTMWGPVLDELDAERRVLALDLPGHGDSDALPSYRLDAVAERIHDAVEEAGFGEPVVVGHSVSGVIASIYAVQYPAAGVISADQVLATERFRAELLAVEDLVRGPQFDAVWQQLRASMHFELVPAERRALIEAPGVPSRELALGYWDDLLTRPQLELRSLFEQMLEKLRSSRMPYHLIAGSDPGDDYRTWLAEVLPQARITVYPNSGHFPHLVDPQRFAAEL